jgi:flagellin-like hook-associated protein FlgL
MASFGDISRIRTNIGAFNALNTLNLVNKGLTKFQLQLATGRKINSAGDDPSGFSMAKELEGKARRYGQVLDNIGDAKNVFSTAETGMVAIKDILIQMSEKATRAASDTLGTEDRNKIEVELQQLADEIDDIVDQTQWRDVKLLDGTYTNTTLWVGPESNLAENSMDISLNTISMDSTNLQVRVGGSTANAAAAAWSDLQTAMVDDIDWAQAWADLANVTLAAAFVDYTELSSGIYRVEVNRGAVFTYAPGGIDTVGLVTISIQVRDENGELVNIDANNIQTLAGGAADAGLLTAMTYALTAATRALVSAADGEIDIGRGFNFTVLATGSGFAYNFSVEFDRSEHSVDTSQMASAYLADVLTALESVDTDITTVGGYEQRIELKEDRVAGAEVDVWAAYSRLMNADMAKTQLQITKYLILQQAAVAGLAQANTAPSFVLGLMGG